LSIDYGLWKWRDEPPRITAGLAFLLLAEGIECEEIAPLDVARLQHEIEHALPEQRHEVTFAPAGILLNTGSGTPADVVAWFESFAIREGLVFFDPQDPHAITDDDRRTFRTRMERWNEEHQAARNQALLPALISRGDEGDAQALFTLGNLYSFGEGVQPDAAQAAHFYERAAMAGWSDAMFNLAGCYRVGEGVPKDAVRALFWYERAAQKDPAFAYCALGEMYANGEAGTVDREKAVHYLQLAWDHGNPAAYKLLRSMGAKPR
jgi:TPR repeat protein